MAMMTTVEKILAKAHEFEEKARALRLAASLLNGDVRERKVETLDATLSRAKRVRALQVATTEALSGNGYEPSDDSPKARIRAALGEGAPLPVKVLAKQLRMTPNGALYHLARMDDVKKVGHGNATRYQLRK